MSQRISYVTCLLPQRYFRLDSSNIDLLTKLTSVVASDSGSVFAKLNHFFLQILRRQGCLSSSIKLGGNDRQVGSAGWGTSCLCTFRPDVDTQ